MVSIVLTSLLGCSAPAVHRVREPHFDEWDRLVPAVLLGRRSAYRTMVRSLAGPDSVDVGAATGFLQVAGPEERLFALTKLASACGGCHRTSSVAAPSRPTTHAFASVAVLDAWVFPDATAVPLPDVPKVQQCRRCHDEDGRVRSDLE